MTTRTFRHIIRTFSVHLFYLLESTFTKYKKNHIQKYYHMLNIPSNNTKRKTNYNIRNGMVPKGIFCRQYITEDIGAPVNMRTQLCGWWVRRVCVRACPCMCSHWSWESRCVTLRYWVRRCFERFHLNVLVVHGCCGSFSLFTPSCVRTLFLPLGPPILIPRLDVLLR